MLWWFSRSADEMGRTVYLAQFIWCVQYRRRLRQTIHVFDFGGFRGFVLLLHPESAVTPTIFRISSSSFDYPNFCVCDIYYIYFRSRTNFRSMKTYIIDIIATANHCRRRDVSSVNTIFTFKSLSRVVALQHIILKKKKNNRMS